MQAHIRSTGFYIPTKKVTNDDLAKTIDTSDEWIYSHTGIHSRYIAAEDQAASDLAYEAASQALSRGSLTGEDLDLILLATATPDYLGFPSTASILQDRLGAKKAGAVDLSAACTGFVYALETARAFIESGSARHILVVGTEVFSRILDWQDRNTCVLFGDGAGAVVVSAGDQKNRGILPGILRSDGEGAHSLLRPLGGTRRPLALGLETLSDTYVKMDGRKVYNFAIRVVKEVVLEVLEKNQLTLDQVKWFVPHQANLRIIESAAKRMEVGMDRFYTNIEHYANTSGATIPIALAEMDQKGLLNPGDLVVTVGFGAGLTYGANLLRW